MYQNKIQHSGAKNIKIKYMYLIQENAFATIGHSEICTKWILLMYARLCTQISTLLEGRTRGGMLPYVSKTV